MARRTLSEGFEEESPGGLISQKEREESKITPNF
jgi:preprotein translocase subunit Sec61beta